MPESEHRHRRATVTGGAMSIMDEDRTVGVKAESVRPVAPSGSPAPWRQRLLQLSRRPGAAVGGRALTYMLLLVVPLVAFDQRWMAFATLAGMWGIGALGLGLILGYGGQLSLGHAALVGVGAYVAGILARDAGLGYGIPLLAGTVAAIAVALVALPILRLRGYYLALATLAMGLVVERLIAVWDHLTGGPSGLAGIPDLSFGPWLLDTDYKWWVFTVVVIALMQLLIRRLVTGSSGRAIAVLHEDEDLMPALRMHPMRLKATLFVIGSGMAGLSGGMLAHRLGFLAPEQFGVETSILLALVVLLGGATSWWGPLIGVGLLRLMPELFGEEPHLRGMLIPVLVIVLTFIAPHGVAGLVGRLWEAVRRRLSAGPIVASPEESLPKVMGPSEPYLESPLLDVRSVSKAFGGVRVLLDVSFDVRAGEVVGLIGPNGAGKTTLLNAIAGQIEIDTGEISYKGTDVGTLSAEDDRRSGMVRTYQTPRLVDRISVIENVSAGADHRHSDDGDARRAANIELLRLGREGMAGWAPSSLPFGGMRATELARALVMQPELLLLDEPAAGLGEEDLTQLDQLLQDCAQAGIAVVLVEHNMEFLTQAVSRVVALANGVVVAEGPPEKVLADAEVIEHYLGATR